MKKSFIQPLWFAVAFFCCVACSKEQLSSEAGNGKTVVNFTATENVETKAAANIPTGATASLYVYQRTTQTTTAPFTTKFIDNKTYSVSTAGTLTAAQSMYLDKGWFDIYAWGVYTGAVLTSSESTISAAGASGQLGNGRDYIFANPAYVTVSGLGITTTQNVTLNFDHVATKMTLNITNDASLTTYSVSSVTLTPSTPSTTTTFSFSTGTITAAAAVGAATAMSSVTASKQYQYIMLPLAASKQLTFTINGSMTVAGGGASQSMSYSAKVTPSTALTGGNEYKFNATLTATGITFTNATVNEWGATTDTTLNTDQES